MVIKINSMIYVLDMQSSKNVVYVIIITIAKRATIDTNMIFLSVICSLIDL